MAAMPSPDPGDYSVPDWRIAPRKCVDYPVVLLTGRARFQARLVDVSESGVKLSTRTARNIGESYDFEIREHAEVEIFRCQVLWDYFLEDHFVSGAEMIFAEPADRRRWKAWLQRLPEQAEDAYGERSFEQRACPRVPTTRPILFKDRHRWVKGAFRNISEGGSGALLVVRAQHPPGGVVHFKVRIDAQVYPFRAQAVWSRLVGGDYQIGVKFIEPMPGSDAKRRSHDDLSPRAGE